MPRGTPGQTIAVEHVFDLTSAPSIEEAGSKLTESYRLHAEQGYHIVSASHAYGPVEGADRWSILILYGRARSESS